MSTKSSVCNCFTNLFNLLFIILFYFLVVAADSCAKETHRKLNSSNNGFHCMSVFFVSLILSVFYLIFSVLTASDADEVERHPPVLVKPVSGSSQDNVKHESWD